MATKLYPEHVSNFELFNGANLELLMSTQVQQDYARNAGYVAHSWQPCLISSRYLSGSSADGYSYQVVLPPNALQLTCVCLDDTNRPRMRFYIGSEQIGDFSARVNFREKAYWLVNVPSAFSDRIIRISASNTTAVNPFTVFYRLVAGGS